MTAIKPLPDVPRPARVKCPECSGRGLIKLWPPGHEERACMARCEHCSGFGKVGGA